MFTELEPRSRRILYSQLAYMILVIAWNIAGIVLIANGLPAPGPTASLIGAGIIAVLGAVLVYGCLHKRWIYFLISALLTIGAIAAIYTALTAEPTLWPSDFWRYAGIALNLFGAFVCSIAVFRYLLRRQHENRA